MDFRKQKLSIVEAKEMDMVQYLSLLGYEPSKIRNNDYWYVSPLRREKTPSFKVNRKLNRWYDHGLGKGGNIIDFGIEYHGCSVGEFLKKLDGGFSFQKTIKNIPKIENASEYPLKILKEVELSSYTLISYMGQRKIPVEIATQYCREVHYELNAKSYYGIGFKNDSDGFEIRNPYLKASSSPKDITTEKNGSDEVTVFEGFMDFLSFKSIRENEVNNTSDFVILNSLSLFEKARPFLESHKSIKLYLDNNAAGQKVAREALSNSKKNPDDPKIVFMGNNPQKIQIYGAILSLYVNRLIKMVNKEGKLKSSLIFDEFPTIYLNNMDSLIATARSNKVSTCLGNQDFSQLRKDYGREQADVIMNITGNIVSGQVTGDTAKLHKFFLNQTSN